MQLAHVYRVTKYDPADRDERGHYVGIEDVTSDHGTVEAAYLHALAAFAEDSGIEHLAVREPQVPAYAHFGIEPPVEGLGLDGLLPLGLSGFHDGAEVPLAVALELVRAMLRDEGVWCRLEVEGMFSVHVGWDQYLYIGSSRPCVDALRRTRRLGLVPRTPERLPVRLRGRRGRHPAARRRRLLGIRAPGGPQRKRRDPGSDRFRADVAGDPEPWYRYRAAVTATPSRPLLFLDVDGPLIPFGASPQEYPDGYPTYRAAHEAGPPTSNPLLARIDPEHGRQLMALPCDLVWATTWMHEANDCVSPRIGLPRLPVVVWPEPSDSADEEADEREGLHWKTRALVEWAAGRAFAWVDDEISEADRAWVAAHHHGRALLHRVDPRHGLRGADYRTLSAWLHQAGARQRPHRSGA